MRCSGCGFPRDETMDPDAFQRYDAKPLRCHACMVASQTRHQFQQDKNDPHGVYFPVYDREA